MVHSKPSPSPAEREKVSDLQRKGKLPWRSSDFFHMQIQKGNKGGLCSLDYSLLTVLMRKQRTMFHHLISSFQDGQLSPEKVCI